MRVLRLFRALLLVLFVLSAAQASGEEQSSAVTEEKSAAEQAFLLGSKLYAEGNYGEALAQLEASYRLSKFPLLLVNIGKCKEKLGDNAGALKAYEDFLAKADAKDLGDEGVGARDAIIRLKTLIKPEPTVSEKNDDEITSPPPSPAPSSKKTLYKVGAGLAFTVGAVGAIGGAISLLVANSRYNSLVSACNQRCDPSRGQEVLQPQYAGVGFFVGGGIFLGLGGISLYYSR